jgi:hypothetical protein
MGKRRQTLNNPQIGTYRKGQSYPHKGKGALPAEVGSTR